MNLKKERGRQKLLNRNNGHNESQFNQSRVKYQPILRLINRKQKMGFIFKGFEVLRPL